MSQVQQAMHIAKEIINQIKAFDPFALMAWGTTELRSLSLDELKEFHSYGGIERKAS